MDKLDIINVVTKLGDHEFRKGVTAPTGWYQSFDLPGITTVNRSPTSVRTFRKILTLFDFPIMGSRMLDIGSNAGLHCIEASILGISCVGLESKDAWISQAEYIKIIYEEMIGKTLDITYEKYNLMDDDITSLGTFDYCLALGVLTELPFSKGYRKQSPECILQQTKALSKLHSVTNTLIISTNNTTKFMNVDYYKQLLSGKFKLKSTVNFSNMIYARFDKI